MASDGKGGECPGSVTVCVPHDKGKKGSTCVDDGQNYDSVTGGPAAKPVVGAGNVRLGTPGNLDIFVGSPAVRYALEMPENLVYELSQNAPNPFNPTTTIRYTLSEASDVRLVIYNVLGQPVRVLVNGAQGAGVYNVVWDGRDGQGHEVTSGVYLYRLVAGEHLAVRKMILAK